MIFQADKYDSYNNPIQLIDKVSGDMILFEVSYNTIEFAFAKAERISEVEERLDTYLSIIQPYLQNHNHELQGWGVNPNWAKNDNRPVKSPRYEMLMDLVWHEDYTYYSRKAVNNHVSNLRKKLKIAPDLPDYIKSVYGIGYKFEVE